MVRLAFVPEQLPFFPVVWIGDRSKGMKLSWRQVKHELANARDADLLLAVIASFVAWIITSLFRVVFG
jgi:hypothetical protein